MGYGAGSFGVSSYGVVDVIVDHAIAIGITSGVIVDHAIAVHLPGIVIVDHSIQVAFDAVTVDHALAVGLPPEVVVDHAIQVAFRASQIFQVYPGAGQISSNFYKYGARVIIHDSVAGEKDITAYVTSGNINMSRGEPATCKVTLLDKDRKFRPYLEAGDEFYDLFDGANYNDDNEIKRYLTIELALYDEAKQYCNFFITDYDWSLGPTGMPEVTLTGTDYSDLLLEEDANFDDFVSVPGDIWTVKRIVRHVLQQKGLSDDQILLEFEDMDVHRLSPSGTYLDIIRDALYYVQAEWFWDRDVFVAHDRNFVETGGAHWTIVDTEHVLNVSVKRSNRAIINHFIGSKGEALSEVLATHECVGPECLGFNTISFEPSVAVGLRVTETASGIWKDPVWFLGGVDGQIRDPGSTGSYGPVDTVRFVYEPFIPFLADTPRIKAQVVGRRLTDLPLPDGFESYFKLEVVSDASKAKYGTRKAKSTISSTVWSTQEDCQRTLTLLMEESARTAYVASVNCPLLPGVIPARTVKLINGFAGTPWGENYYVESVDINFAATGMFLMGLELTRYRPEEV